MRITFFGAAGEVTGSQHLVEAGGHRILLDCGLHQGGDMIDRNRHFSFDPVTIDVVVVSHAHLDHVGLLPLLVAGGFRGLIYSTGATRDLAEQILLDAANLQQQEADFRNRHLLADEPAVIPLYGPSQVPPVMTMWKQIPYTHDDPNWQEILPGVQVKLYDAGHILGSAVISLQIGQERLAYTGDLGRYNSPLLRDPEPIQEQVATLILEATYGDRLHEPVATVNKHLIDIVNTAVALKSKIIVPAFSLGRTQELVYILHRLTDQGLIPRIPIYVDSPLAGRVTEVFERHHRDYDRQAQTDFGRLGENPLVFRNLIYTHSVEESKALNQTPGPLMIISASGMASGGRIMHHLQNGLSDPNNIVLFTGYQAVHTTGRRLINGEPQVKLFGQMVQVKAKLETVNDLSAHADAAELEAYAAAISGLQRVFLVHAEPDRAQALARRLVADHPDWQVTIPQLGQSFELNQKPA